MVTTKKWDAFLICQQKSKPLTIYPVCEACQQVLTNIVVGNVNSTRFIKEDLQYQSKECIHPPGSSRTCWQRYIKKKKKKLYIHIFFSLDHIYSLWIYLEQQKSKRNPSIGNKKDNLTRIYMGKFWEIVKERKMISTWHGVLSDVKLS